MALVDRTAKPPVGVPLRSDGHWSVTGLGIALPFNETSGISVKDAVSGTVATHTSSQADVGPVTVDGRLLFQSGANGSGAGIPVTTGNIPTSAATMVCGHIVHTTNGTFEAVFGGSSYGGSLLTTRGYSTVRGVALCYGLDYGWVFSSDGPGLAVGAITGSTSFSTGAYNTIAGVYDGGFKIYQNGALKGQNNFNLAGTFSAPFDGDGYRIADNINWSASAHMFLDFVLAYTRALSDAEIVSISANPWQIFQQVDDGGSGAMYSQSVAGLFPALSGSAVRQMSKMLAGTSPTLSGAASHNGSFEEAVAGSFPAPSGGIVKKTGKMLSGAVPAAAGAAIKLASKILAGNMPTATGNAGHGAVFHVPVAGIMGAIAGAVATVLNPLVVAARAVLNIIGAGFKKIIGG